MTHEGSTSGQEVALKIVKSAATYKDAALDEIKILKVLAIDAAQPCVLGLIDDFTVSGPNGTRILKSLGIQLLFAHSFSISLTGCGCGDGI